MKQSKKIKYDIAVFGDCVRGMFVVAPATILPGKKIYGEELKYLAYPYGEKITVQEVHYDLGGSGCNAAVGMRKCGLSVAFGSVIGNKVSREQASKILKRVGIDSRYIYRGVEQNRGFSLVMVGPDRDRTIFVYHEVNDYSVINIDRMMEESGAMYIAGISRESEKLLPKIIDQMCCNGKDLYVNPSRYQLEKKNRGRLIKLLEDTHVVCMNLLEAATLVGHNHSSIEKIIREIYKIGPRIVIVTMGKQGAICFDGKRYFKSGIWKTERVDTTGAGDAFFSTFVAEYIRTKNIEKALRYGTINSGSVVTKFGAQKGLLRLSEIRKISQKTRIKIDTLD